MSITIELSRIQTNRNTIRAKLVELGMATSTDKLDALASAIENLVNRGAVNVEVKEGETYTIPAGYHNGSGVVSGVSGGGNYTLQTKPPVTPTKNTQNVAPDPGYYGLSGVTVNPIPEAYQDVSSVTAGAGDVLTGKIIVLADGTVKAGEMVNNGAVDKTLDATTITYTIPKGYHSGSGKVKLVLETMTVTPKKSAQDVTPTAGKVLSKVTVAAIPDKYQDVTNVDAGAADVLVGKTIVSATGEEIEGAMVDNGAKTATLDAGGSYTIPAGYHNGSGKVTAKNLVSQTAGTAEATEILSGETAWVDGTKVTGSMPNNGSTSGTIDGLATTSVTIPAGYTSGGTVSLTSDIEDALAAI
jgi:hypothetical protein